MILRTSAHPELFNSALPHCPALRRKLDAASASCRCDRHCKALQSRQDPANVVITRPDCKSRKCPDCRPRKDRNDLVHFFDTCAGHKDTLHVLRLPAGVKPRATADLARRCGVFYHHLRLDDGGSLFVLSDHVDGAKPVDLVALMETLADAVDRLAAVRHPISQSRQWKNPETDGSGEWDVIGVGPGRNAVAAVKELLKCGFEVSGRAKSGRSISLRAGASLTSELISEAVGRLVRYVGRRRGPAVGSRGARPQPDAPDADSTPNTPRRNIANLTKARGGEPGTFRRAA